MVTRVAALVSCGELPWEARTAVDGTILPIEEMPTSADPWSQVLRPRDLDLALALSQEASAEPDADAALLPWASEAAAAWPLADEQQLRLLSLR